MAQQLRLGELVAALSLAIDLGMGQPMEQALRTCLIATRFGERLGLSAADLSNVYYAALLRFLGCTADAHETAAIVGDELVFRANAAPVLDGSLIEFVGRAVSGIGRGEPPLRRLRIVGGFLAGAARIRSGAQAHCEVAVRLAERLGLGQGVQVALAHALERWDGQGLPGRAAGEAVSLASRVVFVARDAEVLHRLYPTPELLAIVRRRRGAAYDPAIAAAFERYGPALLAQLDAESAWSAVLEAEPQPRLGLEAVTVDRALEAFADFVDLKSPFTLGHSRGVAALAADAAHRLHVDEAGATSVQRAGLVHDLGRIGVSSRVCSRNSAIARCVGTGLSVTCSQVSTLQEVTMPTAEINGAALYYEEAGSGPPLLFIHGMCGSADVWRGQVDRLASRFRCVAYDRRGHTRSSLGDVQQRTVDLHADDAAALIRALDLAPCLLVGSSGGARVGLNVVRRYPRLLAGAVLSEPPLLSLDREVGAVLMADVKPAVERAVATGGPPAAVDAFFDLLCPGLWRKLDAAGRAPYLANHREFFGDLQMPPETFTLDDLRAVDVPCLLVTGDQSHPSLRRIARMVSEAIPRAELIELRDCGHVTYAEQPEAFAEAVVDFARRPGLIAGRPISAS